MIAQMQQLGGSFILVVMHTILLVLSIGKRLCICAQFGDKILVHSFTNVELTCDPIMLFLNGCDFSYLAGCNLKYIKHYVLCFHSNIVIVINLKNHFSAQFVINELQGSDNSMNQNLKNGLKLPKNQQFFWDYEILELNSLTNVF